MLKGLRSDELVSNIKSLYDNVCGRGVNLYVFYILVLNGGDCFNTNFGYRKLVLVTLT
jgi:hypothetical protein